MRVRGAWLAFVVGCTAARAAVDLNVSTVAELQRAIDAANRGGGGVVTIAPGPALIVGTVHLKSNVTLHLPAGSRLVASDNPSNYEDGALIVADQAENIAITGPGEIDGQAAQFMAEELPHIYRPKSWRPRLVRFEACRRVRLAGLTLRNSPNWTVHLLGCEDVAIAGVTIRNDLRVPNCDGIVPDHCRNVTISDCDIVSGDDCVVIKTTPQGARYGASENLTIRDCTLQSSSAALKIGTETASDIRGVRFSHCTIRRSHRGVAIALRDEGSIADVRVEDITIETQELDRAWWGAGEAIYVSARPRQAEGRVGSIQRVTFENIRARGPNGVFVSAVAPNSRVELAFSRVIVEMVFGSGGSRSWVDDRPGVGSDAYPEAAAAFRLLGTAKVAADDCGVVWPATGRADAIELAKSDTVSLQLTRFVERTNER